MNTAVEEETNPDLIVKMGDTKFYFSQKPRELEFLGTSLDDLKEFPVEVKKSAGKELRRIQLGEKARHGRSIKVVGAGAFEIKIRDRQGAFRVFYVAKFEDTVYVLHAFQKKSQRTSKKDITIGQRRYENMLELRKQN